MAHQSLARLAVVASISVPFVGLSYARAQDATAPAADAAPTTPIESGPVDAATTVDNYWHYGKIARYDLQNAEGKKLLDAKIDPATLLQLFENTAAQRGDNLDDWILRWQGVKEASTTATSIAQELQKGRFSRRADQNYIETQIKRLGNGERAYILAIQQLRESGELAAPLMISYLQNPAQASLHGPIRRALRDLGRAVINPLVAATEMKKDTGTLLTIIDVLSEIGYDVPAPYLARLAQGNDVPLSVQSAARAALARLGAPQSITAPDAFFELAERVYYGKSALSVDLKAPVAYVWFWDDTKGLTKKDVPPAIFGPVMAMREAEYSMKLGNSQGNALSLWLAADYKREALLPDGKTDATRPDNYPSAHYFGVSAGVSHLYATLSRALNDNDSVVAIRAIKSLREIVGASSLSTDSTTPLVSALQFPDRLVRYEAAFALAAANPKQPFTGSERVVPLLAEAISQTGTSNVVVLAPQGADANAVDLNKTLQGLKAAGIGAVGGTTAQEAMAASNTLPSVDAIVIFEAAPRGEIDSLMSMAASSPRLERTPRIVIVQTGASSFVAQAATNPLLSTIQSNTPDAIKGQLEVARQKAGSLPLDEKTATEYALKSAALLQQLSGRTQAYDLLAAETALEAALSDSRPEIVKAAGNVLASLDTAAVQPALLQAATAEKAADDVKVSLFKSLAMHAKQFGERLSDDQRATLEKTVEGATNLDVRAAAAEVRGALNLPADQAKALIIEQART
jgi:hypothetical protein